MKSLWIAVIAITLSLPDHAVSEPRNPLAIEAPCLCQGHGNPFDPDDAEPPRQVQIQVEFIELSHEALTELLFKSKPTTSDATALRESLQEMIKRKEATVLETQLITARSGERATAESIHEFIYPTEYDPPSHPVEGASEDKAVLIPPGHPTAFEVRNTGSTLEAEPVIDGDSLISIRLVPELIWHTGNTAWGGLLSADHQLSRAEMPDFYVLRARFAITCASGQYTLAGVLSPKNQAGRMDQTRKVMMFVKCDILEVRPDAKPASPTKPDAKKD